MSHESTPKQLSPEQQADLDQNVADTKQVALEAWTNGANTYNYNYDIDSRRIGSVLSDNSVRQKVGRIDFKTSEDRKGDDYREAHAYHDKRFRAEDQPQVTHLKVRRNGERKELRSENPLVYKMVAEIALKGVRNESQAELEAHKAKKAA